MDFKKEYKNTYPITDERFKKWLEENKWEKSKHFIFNQYYISFKGYPTTHVFTLYDWWYNKFVDNNFTSEALTKHIQKHGQMR